MNKKNKNIIIANISILAIAILLGFPGILAKLVQSSPLDIGRVSLSYSYFSSDHRVDVKDEKNKKDVDFIFKELDKSKVLGTNYPGEITQKGSFFIIKRYKGSYEIIASICWYGEKTDVCLVNRGSEGNQYVSMTSGLQKFMNSKFASPGK
jgi:hypothetical protein